MTAPLLDQDSVRGRVWCGTEAAANYITTSNADFDRAADTPWRIRFLIQEYNNGMAVNIALKLQRNYNSGGWVDVTTSSSVVRAVAHHQIVDASDCTQQIGAGTFISNNDGFSHDGTCGGGNLDFAGNDEAEVEFCVEIIGADVTVGLTMDFRVVETDGTQLDNYTFTPTVTIIDPVYTTIGSSDRSTNITAVSGVGPWTVTITDGSVAKAGDALWDEHATPRQYRITAISGNDLTVVDSEAVGSAPDNSGTSTPYVKRYYATLSSWEADLDDTNLYQAGDDAVADMYADADFNMSALTINGGGTVKLNSAQIRAASGEQHTGTPGTGVTIKGASVTGEMIKVSQGDVYTVIEGIEIDFNGDSGESGANVGILGNNGTLLIAIRRCMVHYSARRLSSPIKESPSGACMDIHNNAVFNFVYGGTNATTQAGIDLASSRRKRVFNNTVHEIQLSNGSNTGNIYGFRMVDNANEDYRNNIATDCTTAGSGTAQDYSVASPASATVDYNIASDTSASGANSHDSESSSSLFVSNAAPYNLHLASTATNAIDGGVDLGTDPLGVELDVDLRDRDTEADTWDIGWDEYVAGAITANAAQTLPSLTQSASAAVDVGGTAAQSLPSVSQAASVSVEVACAAAQTLPGLGQSATATTEAIVTAAQTLPALTQSASVSVAITAAAAQTLPSLTQAAAGSVDVTASAAQALPSLAQLASVTTSGAITANAAQTLPALSQTASVSVPVAASAAQTLPSIAQSASVDVLAAGTVTQTLPSVTQSASASVDVGASAAQTLPSLSQSAGASVDVTAGAAQTLPALTQSASAFGGAVADASQALPSLTQVTSGTVAIAADAGQALPTIVQAASVSAAVSAANAQVLPALTQSAVLTSGIDAIAAQLFPSLSQEALVALSTPPVSPLSPVIRRAAEATGAAPRRVSVVSPAPPHRSAATDANGIRRASE